MRLHEDRLDDHLTDDEVRERFAALDRMASIHDPLGAGGAEDFTRHGPSLGSMLIPAFVLLAFAAGWFLAYASHGTPGPCVPWQGDIATLLTMLRC